LKTLAHFIITTFKVDNNTAAALTISICTFVLGIIISVTLNAIIKYINNRSYRKSLNLVVQEFINSCKRQHREYTKFFQQKGFLEGDDFTIPVVPNPTKNYLASLDLHAFTNNFSAPLIKKRAKCISKLFKIIAMVEYDATSLTDSLKVLTDRYAQHEARYQQNLDALRKYFDDNLALVAKNTLDREVDALMRFIDKTFAEWINNGKKNEFANTCRHIINPIYEFAVQQPPNIGTRLAVDTCINCRAAFVDMVKDQELLSDRVRTSMWIYKSAFKAGELVLRNLRLG
jgi:hypothetical protein